MTSVANGKPAPSGAYTHVLSARAPSAGEGNAICAPSGASVVSRR